MRRLAPLVLLVLFVAARPAAAEEPTATALAAAARAAGSVNGRCPVMGRLVTPGGGSVEYRGERIAFCCKGCIAKFEAEPARWMDAVRAEPARYGYTSRWPEQAALERARTAAGSANGLCPVMGKPVKPGVSIVHAEQTIAFCCPPCIPKFKAEPERWLRAMRADPGAYAYQRPGPTTAQIVAAREKAGAANGLCPVRRLLVKEGAIVEHAGQRIAFCCEQCAGRFRAEPQRWLTPMREEPARFGYLPPSR